MIFWEGSALDGLKHNPVFGKRMGAVERNTPSQTRSPGMPAFVMGTMKIVIGSKLRCFGQHCFLLVQARTWWVLVYEV